MHIPSPTRLHIPLAHPCSYYYLLGSPSILFLHILFVLHILVTLHFFILLHILLFISLFFFFTYIYIYALVLCYFYLTFIFLHCPLSGSDLHFTSDYTLYNLVCDE